MKIPHFSQQHATTQVCSKVQSVLSGFLGSNYESHCEWTVVSYPVKANHNELKTLPAGHEGPEARQQDAPGLLPAEPTEASENTELAR